MQYKVKFVKSIRDAFNASSDLPDLNVREAKYIADILEASTHPVVNEVIHRFDQKNAPIMLYLTDVAKFDMTEYPHKITAVAGLRPYTLNSMQFHHLTENGALEIRK